MVKAKAVASRALDFVIAIVLAIGVAYAVRWAAGLGTA
jgi:hypothetical protein